MAANWPVLGPFFPKNRLFSVRFGYFVAIAGRYRREFATRSARCTENGSRYGHFCTERGYSGPVSSAQDGTGGAQRFIAAAIAPTSPKVSRTQAFWPRKRRQCLDRDGEDTDRLVNPFQFAVDQEGWSRQGDATEAFPDG